jgi:hypothetical protein
LFSVYLFSKPIPLKEQFTMTSVIEWPQQTPTNESTTNESNNEVGEQLRTATTAIRLHVRWPGVRKTLSQRQRQLAAGAFSADANLLSAGKKLFDTSHPVFRAVSTVKSQAVSYWRSQTLPYVEPGVRLVKRGMVLGLESYLRESQLELQAKVRELDQCWYELVDQARTRLGDLFDPTDYPPSITDEFEITWDYPSTTPPDYLRSVAPEVYEEECRRVRERFNEAVTIAENAFAEELAGLVAHLAERLSGDADGKPKVFRDTAVTNLQEFFSRFRRLSIGSDDSLERLVQQAQTLLGGMVPEDLRQAKPLRERISEGLTRIGASLDGYMTERPRRNIIRRAS